MPFIKQSYELLSEFASTESNTSNKLDVESIRSSLNKIETVSESVNITAEMVPVVAVGEDYLVEMNNLYPFMKCNNIETVEEALDLVSEANKLGEKSVGLLIESDEYFDSLLEKCDSCTDKVKENVTSKIKQAIDSVSDLKEKGYNVKKKIKQKLDENAADIGKSYATRYAAEKMSGNHLHSIKKNVKGLMKKSKEDHVDQHNYSEYNKKTSDSKKDTKYINDNIKKDDLLRTCNKYQSAKISRYGCGDVHYDKRTISTY